MAKLIPKLSVIVLAPIIGYVIGVLLWGAVVTLGDTAMYLLVLLHKPGKMTLGDFFVQWGKWFSDGVNRVGVTGAALASFTAFASMALCYGIKLLPFTFGKVVSATLGSLLGLAFGGYLGWHIGGWLNISPHFNSYAVTALTVAWCVVTAITWGIVGGLLGLTQGRKAPASPPSTMHKPSV